MAVKLAVFDMDGTLLRGDTACLAIARTLGTYDRMLEFESGLSLEQLISAREEMAGWYRSAGRQAVVDALENLRFAPGAIEGVATLQQAGIEVAIVSVTWGFAVREVARSLGVDICVGTELDFETGDIQPVYGTDKGPTVAKFSKERALSAHEVAAIGDTPSDNSMLELAGHAYYVGTEPPTVAGCHHYPDGDIRDIASSIIDA